MQNQYKIKPNTPLNRHQLNNEGCKCLMCQKIILKQNKQYHQTSLIDLQSQLYSKTQKQQYIPIILQIMQWQKQSTRKLRFALPQICTYQNYHPQALISKKKQNAKIICMKNQSKMHSFKIQNFFKEGFQLHQCSQTPKVQLLTHSDAYSNQCIILAKYKFNRYSMLTLHQLQGLFKTKHKDLREGLMYLQTLVGGRYYNETRIKINLKQMIGTQLYQKAQYQVRIITQQIKTTDDSYYSQTQQIIYENKLKQKNIKQYLMYLSLKIILIASKKNINTFSECIFKWVHTPNRQYLWDIRVKNVQPSQIFWSSTATMEALEYKLKKTMSLMEMQNTNIKMESCKMSIRAKQVSKWLQTSTQVQFDEISVIRNRLQKLQNQKRSLLISQSQQQSMQKTFRLKRKPKKRQNKLCSHHELK